MAEGFYHVALPEGAKTHLTNGKDKLIVSAESSAEAILAAKAALNLPSDEAWAASTATLLAHVTDLAGWRLHITVDTAAGASVADVTVTGVTVADFDSIAALAVIALNATASIAGAAYATPTLTIASGGGGDDLGDHVVAVEFLPPTTWDDPTIPFPLAVGTITDEGASNAALTVVLNDVVAPTVLYQVS